ncbi:diacylglycerol kinase [Ectocarpus siliculosus]|uniref:Diacylglycerol kinase n=1 Tax=Ectocarpus siliculosus TaxID=2880 RepID=D7FZ01_ECTSI|nr:diacylglycerol kinase [Ectocarpus siliculosus]|eukprot:CBJ32618.1 diacylglycerol kinase [Ectocarpus siliculosus]
MGDNVAMDNGELKVDPQQEEAQQLQLQQQPDSSSTAEEALQVGPPADAASTTTPASPVLVFLNSASGGKMGPKVLEKIRALIPESQLFDLQEVGQGRWKPEDKLKLFQHTKDTKVLICGGDGTMGWILSCIDRLRMAAEPSPSVSQEENFPVAMMPLGTGNDLARTFGWGPGFTRAMLKPKFLDRVKEAPAARLDRWLLSVMPYEPLGSEAKVKSTKIPPTFSLHRYASAIGDPIGGGQDLAGAVMNDASEHKRTQSVLRIGRSFSVKMSSQAKSVHEDEMNRSSSQGSRSLASSRHGDVEGGFRGSFGAASAFGGEFKTEETAAESERSSITGAGAGAGGGGGAAGGPSMMARASSAPPALRYSGGNAGGGGGGGGGGGSAGVVAMPTVGEVVDVPDREEEEEASSSVGSSSGPSSPVVEVTSKASDGKAAEGTAKKEGGTAAAAAAVVAAVEAEETPQEGGADPTAVENLGATTTGGVEGGSGGGGGGGGGGVEETPVASEPASGSAEEGKTAVVAPAGQDEGKAAEEAAEREANVARGAAATVAARVAAKAARAGEEKTPIDEEGEDGGAAAAAADGILEAAVQTDSQPRRMGPRAMPSISVIQRFETWESYDAVFCNYFSFGVDAIAASAFHEHRQAYPQLFTSRFRNQVWYARKGFPAAGGIPCGSQPPPPPVSKYLELRVKSTPSSDWETLELDNTLRGVVVLNLQSYGGGRNLWGTAQPGCSQKQFAKAAPDDGLLEIVGITNIFKLGCIMGCNKAGARAHRLAQYPTDGGVAQG